MALGGEGISAGNRSDLDQVYFYSFLIPGD